MAVLDEDAVALVRGRQVFKMDGPALRREAGGYERVVIDLGSGDGRFAYRLAQGHPAWFCLAVDASADSMRETSRRASRKPNRGGIPNVRFIRAAVEALPAALRGIADEIYVLYPWGSLLRAVIAPDQAVLRGIARLGRTGARFHVCINASALEDPGLMARLGLPALNDESIRRWLVPAYAAAGIHIMRWGRSPESPATSWGLRLGQGGPCTVFTLGARVERPAG